MSTEGVHVQGEAVLAKMNTLISNRDLAEFTEFADDALLIGADQGTY